ncbi:MAG: hypothetical protein Kow006_00360 [Gammaproteobacteria bacterium]
MNEDLQPRPRLFVEFAPLSGDDADDIVSLTASDGLVIDAERCPAPEMIRSDAPPAVLVCSEPEVYADWQLMQGLTWVGTGGLDEVARLRDRWPDQAWVPRLSVYKPTVSYHFSNEFYGEGFKFYRPDTGAIRGYRVTDGDVALAEALERARALGFKTLWLHAVDAEQASRGLDLDMLERARRDWQDALWISGGATQPQHLHNLVREGGADAVVVTEAVASRCGCESLVASLEPPEPSGPPKTRIRYVTSEERNRA